MQDEEDLQTQEAFDVVTGEAMALTPPRVENQALSPRSEAGRGLEPLELARPSFESALERFRSAGQVDVDPDDPALFNAYRRSLDYLGDMALGGLDLTDAAFRAAVGITAQALPEDQERSFARDLAAMPEAFMGYSPGRIQAATDRVVEGVGEVGRRLNQPGPMPTVLGSNLGNLAARTDEPARTSGRVTNPLLRSTPKSVNFPDDRDGRILLEYYSPLVSAVEQMPIAKEGSTGQTIMAYLTKRAPNVSAQELNYTLSDLDPNTRYTRKEVIQLLRPSTRTGFRARVLEDPPGGEAYLNAVLNDTPTRYSDSQRQILRDQREQGYFEILLENPGSEVDLPSHHDTDTFAHSRGSIRKDEQGRYLLIEEIQSDALQNIGKVDSRDLDGTDEFVEAYLDELFDDTPYDVVYTAIQDLMNPRQGESREAVRNRIKDFYSSYDIEVSGRDARALHMDGIRKLTPSVSDDFDAADEQLTEFFDDVQSTAMDAAEQRQLESYGEGDIPFSSTQYVRQLLLANIAKAKEEGIERVVIPPIEEIARQRVGTGNLATLDDAIKALRPTYVDSVRKALNTINTESQGQIRIGSQSLPYWDMTQPGQTRKANGLLLDISNFNFDPQTQAARFAEGGMVSMEEQMSLFEMGGLADDGAMRDPVSGNEVPHGSMASEVRDDVPSMLSEGEYVVPADVVRYYGVKFFEDLRIGAKSGLNQMEQTGRIGGEPVDSTPGDEPLSPEEMQMLAEISGMYGGGMVRRGYQEGGVVNKPFTPTPNYTTPGFSLFQPLQPVTPVQVPQTETVTLYGPNGEIATLTLPTDQERYNALIGQGYSTQQKVKQPTVQGGDNDLGGPPDEQDFVFGTDETDGPSGFLSQDKFDALNSDPLAFGQSMLDKQDYSRLAGGIGSAAFGPAGGLISGGIAAAMTANNVAQAKAAVEIAKSRNLDTTELEKNISTYVSNLPNAARVMAELVTGDKVVDRFNNQLTQSALTPTTTTTTTTGKAKGVTTTIPARSDAGLSAALAMTEEQKAAGKAYAERGDDRDTSWSGGQVGTTQEDRDFSASVQAGEAPAAGKDYAGRDIESESYSGKGYTSGRAKGGLVTRPNKNKSLAKKK